MTEYQRIEQVLKYIGLSARAFAIGLGLKSPQVFYDIKAGKCGISKDLANKIHEKHLNINTAWLLTGTGDMLATAASTPASSSAAAPTSTEAAIRIAELEAEVQSLRAQLLDKAEEIIALQRQLLQRQQ